MIDKYTCVWLIRSRNEKFVDLLLNKPDLDRIVKWHIAQFGTTQQIIKLIEKFELEEQIHHCIARHTSGIVISKLLELKKLDNHSKSMAARYGHLGHCWTLLKEHELDELTKWWIYRRGNGEQQTYLRNVLGFEP